ncbi:MAG: hypothetical protein WCL51_18275 [Bacteroidota bacterium]
MEFLEFLELVEFIRGKDIIEVEDRTFGTIFKGSVDGLLSDQFYNRLAWAENTTVRRICSIDGGILIMLNESIEHGDIE